MSSQAESKVQAQDHHRRIDVERSNLVRKQQRIRDPEIKVCYDKKREESDVPDIERTPRRLIRMMIASAEDCDGRSKEVEGTTMTNFIIFLISPIMHVRFDLGLGNVTILDSGSCCHIAQVILMTGIAETVFLRHRGDRVGSFHGSTEAICVELAEVFRALRMTTTAHVVGSSAILLF